MNYNDFVYDFAVRTAENLEILEQSVSRKKEGHEVTQLINSFVGLLIFPEEKYMEQFPFEFPNEKIKQFFSEERAHSTYPKDNERKYRLMIAHLRNAIAHKRLYVYPYIAPTSEIQAFEFQDIHYRYKDRKFSVVLSVEEIRMLLFEVLKFICEKSNKPMPHTVRI